MNLTIETKLLPNNHTAKILDAYGRTFKQEIFKISAVFKKKHSIFEYRLKNINDDISFHSKEIVLELAKAMYNANVNGKILALNFSSIWNAKSFTLQNTAHTLTLIMGYHQMMHVPICWNDRIEKRFTQGTINTLIICHTNDEWIAYFHMTIDDVKIKS